MSLRANGGRPNYLQMTGCGAEKWASAVKERRRACKWNGEIWAMEIGYTDWRDGRLAGGLLLV